MKLFHKHNTAANHRMDFQTEVSNRKNFQVAEAFKLIRTNLLFTLSKGKNSLLVTSPEPGVGKSVVASNLAQSLAQTQAKVLLIDADMRQSMQHRIFECPNSDGLSRLLSDQGEAEEMIQPQSQLPNLHLLTAGPLPPNPVELLTSERMRELLGLFSKQYDYVVIDTPPVGLLSDALVLVPQVSGAVLVTKYHKTTYDMLKQSAEAIYNAQGTVLGVILNQVEENHKEFGQKGYYSKYGKYYSGYDTVVNPTAKFLRTNREPQERYRDADGESAKN